MGARFQARKHATVPAPTLPSPNSEQPLITVDFRVSIPRGFVGNRLAALLLIERTLSELRDQINNEYPAR